MYIYTLCKCVCVCAKHQEFVGLQERSCIYVYCNMIINCAHKPLLLTVYFSVSNISSWLNSWKYITIFAKFFWWYFSNPFSNKKAARVFPLLAAVCTSFSRDTLIHDMGLINSSPPGQDGHHFVCDIFRFIFLIECSVCWLEFHWRVLWVQLIITQHWLR